ncbi:Crp/Fnr family transcriptional regulator, partial [Roseococcus sp.]
RGVARAMYTAQLVDAGTMRAWITSMGRRTSAERVAHLMCDLYLRANNICQTNNSEISLPLSQILLADALGMTPVHLNRILKEFRQQEIMRLERGQLIIMDPINLAKIAGFDENYLHRRMRRPH